MKFGISIYPEKQNKEEIFKYLEMAANLNYSRLFTSMLQVNEENKKQMISLYKEIFLVANKLGYEIVLDIAPSIFKKLNIKLPDISFFKNLGVDIIRFDEPTSEGFENQILKNIDIKVEINISTGTDNINGISNINNRLLGCHNFYPQKYTGLDEKYFLDITKFYKDKGIFTSAFISSGNAKSFGPWDIANYGLPTLEKHRNLSSKKQALELARTGLIDCIIFGNSFATRKELEEVSKTIEKNNILNIEVSKEITNIENEIIFNYNNHFRRKDISPYMIRSTSPRLDFSNEMIVPRKNKKDQEIGDIYILNESYGRYKGEVQIILKKMEYDSGKNYIGRVKNKSDLRFILSGTKFRFK